MPLADPRSWQVLPYGDEDAFRDFLGQLELWHKGLASTLRSVFGLPSYALPPLGDGGGSEWLDAVQTTLAGECSVLGIAPPADLRSYDLSDPDQFASWTWLLGEEHVRIRQAAGV